MGMEELEIVIEPDGTTRIHVKGIRGARCLDVTRRIEEALGEVIDRKYTSEYYEESDQLVIQDTMKHRKMEK
jgi:hypothetical protein